VNQIGVQVFLLKICHSIKAFNIIASAILLFSFFLISSQTSISQPVDFDFMFGSSGGGAGQFDFPNGIAVDSMKNIYVVDESIRRVQVFSQPQEFFTLNFNIQGIGSVISTPEGIDCPEDCTEDFMSGEVVTLTPITQGNSFFSGWSGDPDCTDGVVTMVEDTTCTATFINNIPIPTLSEWGLIAMAGILGLVGFMVMRRRKVRA